MNERTYETAVARVEEIIRRLDSGDAGLRETLELVKEGRELVEYCAGELDAAGRRARGGRVVEDREERVDLGRRRRLVERDAEGPLVDAPEVHPPRARGRHPRVDLRRLSLDAHGVEEPRPRHAHAELFQPEGQRRRVTVHALGDGPDPARPVVDGEEARHALRRSAQRRGVRQYADRPRRL